MLQSEGLGLMVWSPLAGGLLAGKYTLGEDDNAEGEGRRAKLDFPRVDKKLAFDLVEAMRPMAESRGLTVSAIAIAWLLHQEVVSTVIVGARRADQLAENLAASEVELSAVELARLDALGAPEPEYPGWAIASQTTRHGFRVSPRRKRQ
jgi:aryl-alcohol dehydrogenase-like predicted oxidoreductase